MALELENVNVFFDDSSVTSYYQDKLYTLEYLTEIDSIKTQFETIYDCTFDKATIQLISEINNPRVVLITGDEITKVVELAEIEASHSTLMQDLRDVRALIEVEITNQINA